MRFGKERESRQPEHAEATKQDFSLLVFLRSTLPLLLEKAQKRI